MKLFGIHINTNTYFLTITIFGIKISVISKKLLNEKIKQRDDEILHINTNIIETIKKNISKLQKKQYDICFLELINKNEFSNLLEYFKAYNYKIIKTKEFPKLFYNFTLQDLIILLSSKVVITTHECSITNLLFPHQILVNLWHACGVFKKVGFDRDDYEKMKKTPYRSNYFVTSSNIVNEAYSKSFTMPIERFISLGVCRTDNLFNYEYINNVRTFFYRKYPKLKNKKVFFFCPTFREIGYEFVFNCSFSLQKLSSLLKDNEVFIFKMHPLVSKNNTNMHNVNNNILDMSEEDILTLLVICDVILTDYSSSFMEGLLLNKPVVFAASDIDKYERGFFIDYRKDLPGEVVESNNVKVLLNAFRNASINHPNYNKFKEYHLGSCDGHSVERVANFIKNILTNTIGEIK